MRRSPKPTKSKEAKSPVARKSPKNQSAWVRDLETRLAEPGKQKREAMQREAKPKKRGAEAQEQQRAPAGFLGVIPHPPADIQSVFETVLQRAVRLCAARYAA